MVVWMADGTDGARPVRRRGRRAGRAHPRPPARERQPRRRAGDRRLRRRAASCRRRRTRRQRDPDRRTSCTPAATSPSPTRCPTVRAGQAITFDNRRRAARPTASGTRSPRARRRATARPASRTRSPTPTCSSTPVSSATPARPTAGPADVGHADRPRRRAPTPTSAASTRPCAARSGSPTADMRRRRGLIIAIAVVVVLLAAGGAVAWYVLDDDSPPPPELQDAQAQPGAAGSTPDGTWDLRAAGTSATGSRSCSPGETLRKTAVGRTSKMSGSSGGPGRHGRVGHGHRGPARRWRATASHATPICTGTRSRPTASEAPRSGSPARRRCPPPPSRARCCRVPVRGDLELHGVTRPWTATLRGPLDRGPDRRGRGAADPVRRTTGSRRRTTRSSRPRTTASSS